MRLHIFVPFLHLLLCSVLVNSETTAIENGNNLEDPTPSPSLSVSDSPPALDPAEETETTNSLIDSPINNGSEPEIETTKDFDSAENSLGSSSQQSLSDRIVREQMSELIATNIALTERIAVLEDKIGVLEGFVATVRNDVHFHHPTMEVQYVDMQVVQWDEALKNGLRKMAIQFQAGYSLGAVSTWEFSLANESNALTVNLLLIDEKYGRAALFAGFTAYVLDTEGNLYSQANALPVNFLDGNGRNLHLPKVIALNAIRNSSNGLLSDDGVFKMRFRLELLGVGHKLYSEMPLSPEPVTKDPQTVVFDVLNISAKLAQNERSGSGSQKNPIAYTRFTLNHDSWLMDTKWRAELHNTGSTDEEDALSIYIILEECPWPELYASFHVEVWDFLNKRVIQAQGTPINNFVKDRIAIEPLLILTQLKEMYDEDDPVSLRFKLQFVVYGQNARYYSDVV